MTYLSAVVFPSLAGATLVELGILSYEEYYHSLPWEYMADRYGGVTAEQYTSWAENVAYVYWAYVTSHPFCK